MRYLRYPFSTYEINYHYPVYRDGKIAFTTSKKYRVWSLLGGLTVKWALKLVARVKGTHRWCCMVRLREPTVFDYTQIDDVQVANIRGYDAPDFVDAYIESASYKGREMTEEELEDLNEDRDFVYDQVEKRLY